MGFDRFPDRAAWIHTGFRQGFETVFFAPGGDGAWHVRGGTAGVQDGSSWAITYEVEVDARWHTRSADIRAVTPEGERRRVIEGDGEGSWRIDGQAAPEFDGLLDVDREASAFTNAFPVRRLDLAEGEAADAPALWVRASGLGVEVLAQRYQRLPGNRFAYAAPGVDFTSELVYDASGLVLRYPGIAERAA